MLLLLACSPDAAPSIGDGTPDDRPGDSDPGVPPTDTAELAPGPGCPTPADLYDEDCVVRYDITLAEADWAAMEAAYERAAANCYDSADLRTRHPATLHYGDTSREVEIRLKGNPCTLIPGGKMQFRIFLNAVEDRPFHDVTSLNLEAANYDPTGQKNGLAFSVFRDVGLVASEANFAALTVNGAYYAVYENIEQVNGHFLDNHYDDPSGNLYWFIWNGHYGALKSNEEVGDTSDWDEMEALVNATPDTVSLEEFEARIASMVDIDEVLLAFATEAVIPQVDGVWAGSANCYVYDNPLGCDGTGCFQYLPWDLDSAFVAPPLDLCPACGSEPDTVTADPITFISGRGPAAKWRLFDLLMDIPERRAQYIADLRFVLDTAYDPDTLRARAEARFAQIDPYMAMDPKMDYPRFVETNAELAELPALRAGFLEEWIAGNE